MAETHASLRRQAHRGHEEKLRRYGGHGSAADERADKALIRKAIREHEDADHGGKHAPLKLKTGGVVEGEHSKPRLDRARGGRTGKGKKHSKTNVNVIVAPQGGGHAVPVPVPTAPHPAMAPHPPMAPPAPVAGMGATPPGLPVRPPVAAGVPGMMRRSGGRTYARGGKVKEEAGAGSGLGRLEKIKEYGRMSDKTEAPAKGDK